MKIIDWFVELISNLASSRVFFIITILVTGIYIQWQGHMSHPFDDPNAGFPKLILVYSLVAFWLEAIIKIAQRKQSISDKELMEKLLELVEAGHRRDEQMSVVLELNEKTSRQILDLVEIRDALKKVEDLESALSSPNAKRVLQRVNRKVPTKNRQVNPKQPKK
jgi:uncharacterized membrane protein